MSIPKQLTSPLAKQIWVVSSVYFTMLGHGMLLGISNCMLPALQSPNSTIPVDVEQASWLNAVVGMSSVLMYLFASSVMACYGRRLATLIGLMPAIISPLICYFAMDIKILLFGRFLSGIGLGAVGLVGVVVIGEYTTPRYRGVFLTLKTWMIVLGFTIVHILGNYLHWRHAMLAMMVPYVISFLIAYTWPESPCWLATKERYDEGIRSFKWLRGQSGKATKELNAMIESQREFNNINEADDMFVKKVTTIFLKFKQKNFLKPLWIYCFAAMLLESSGRHVFPAYAMQIIQQMDSDESNTFFYTMCIDIVINISTFASIVLVKVMKRRTLLLSSGIASVVVLLSVSLYYYLQSKGLVSDEYNAISVALFGLYFLIVNVGCTPVAFALIGELFPLQHRPLGSAMSGVLIAIFMIITLKITPILLTTVKVYGTFTVYGITMAIGLAVLYITLPETKDKTLQEIEEYFNDKPSPKHEVTIKLNEPEVNTKLLQP